MNSLYIPATNTVILDYVTRYIHPVTKEVYGGTDYDDAEKVAEIGAIPLRVLTPAEGLAVVEWVVEDDPQTPGGKQYRPVMIRHQFAAAGNDVATWEIVDDPANPGDKLRRPLTLTPWTITEADLSAKRESINRERARRLESLTVVLDGNTYEADSASRANLTGIVAAINAGIPVGDTVGWRDASDVVRSLKPLKLIELAGLMLSAVNKVYQKSWALKDATLPAVVDPVEFRSYNVSDDKLWA